MNYCEEIHDHSLYKCIPLPVSVSSGYVEAFSARINEAMERAVLDPSPFSGPCVYFIRCGLRGPIKIGTAIDVARRLVHHQIGNPVQLYLLGTMPGNRRTEQALHAKFARQRIRGEWFRPKKRLMAFIAANCPDYKKSLTTVQGERTFSETRQQDGNDLP